MRKFNFVSLKTSIVNTLNNKEYKTAFEVAKIVGASLVDYKKNKSKWSLVSGVGSAILTVANNYEIYSWDYFNSWEPLFSKDFSSLIFDILSEYEFKDINSENVVIRIFNVEGADVGVMLRRVDKGRSDQPYVKAENLEKVQNLIRNKVWEKFQNKNVVIKRNRNLILTSDEDRIEFKIDIVGKPLKSMAANKLAAFYTVCAKQNLTRTLLLYGPPGTGKSTMAREIINQLGYRSFRVKLSDLSSIDTSMLFEAINMFKPDALILDDLDRSHNQDELLETFEVFHNMLKLVVATANNTSRFEKAALRPGRFDDIELIYHLDDDVIKSVLGEHQHLFEKVKHWPIVFIEDLVKRFKIMSPEDAQNAIETLGSRVDYICNSNEYSDDWEKVKKPTNHEEISDKNEALVRAELEENV